VVILLIDLIHQRVWQELQRIPFGETKSYAEIGTAIGQPSAARAVGNANGMNQLLLCVPCHRVITSDGGLGGFTGGVDVKASLLRFEKKALQELKRKRTAERKTSEAEEHETKKRKISQEENGTVTQEEEMGEQNTY